METFPGKSQHEAGEKPGLAVEKAVLFEAQRADTPAAVRDLERVALF